MPLPPIGYEFRTIYPDGRKRKVPRAGNPASPFQETKMATVTFGFMVRDADGKHVSVNVNGQRITGKLHQWVYNGRLNREWDADSEFGELGGMSTMKDAKLAVTEYINSMSASELEEFIDQYGCRF